MPAMDYLQCISETNLSFYRLATRISTLISKVEFDAHQYGDYNNKAIGDKTGHDSWTIFWSICLTENGGANDTSNAAKAYENSRA